jgi:carbamoyltransferase
VLIVVFGCRTGVPVVLNTSFNENEPIVRRPQEAVDCFLRTHMALALGPFLAVKRGAQVCDPSPLKAAFQMKARVLK